MKKILIIDDNQSVRYSFQRLLKEPDYLTITAKNGTEGLNLFQNGEYDLVLLDVRLPDISGLEVIKEIKKADPKAVVIIMTAFGTTETAITAIKLGAYDYILKPFDIPVIYNLILEALNNSYLMRTNVLLSDVDVGNKSGDRIIGNSRVMQEIYKTIGRVAGTDVNILLRGESGTGKELVARAIFQHSQRADKPFLAVNCAAIPETLLESELFGHEKGSFTGAIRRKIGKFEQANKGTIFLDEIGDMSLSTQAKILRVIQEASFERIGGEQSTQIDTRIIAATNKNLEKAIELGQFREDLYYRIKVVTITLPPLRLRREDIIPIIDYFFEKHTGLLKKKGISLSPDVKKALCEYYWPGNIRELENLIRRAIVLCKGTVISKDLFTEEFASPVPPNEISPVEPTPFFLTDSEIEEKKGELYRFYMDKTEKNVLQAVLHKTKGNQVKAAKILGISRVMLRDRIVKYDI